MGFLRRFLRGSARAVALTALGTQRNPAAEPRRDPDPGAAAVAWAVGADLGDCLAAGSVRTTVEIILYFFGRSLRPIVWVVSGNAGKLSRSDQLPDPLRQKRLLP